MATVYITAPEEAAEDLATMLVEERLAACVNRFDCRSTYRWEGEVVRDGEVVLLAKTTEAGYEEVRERVVAAHPYDVPCVERFDESDVYGPFADWVEEQVG